MKTYKRVLIVEDNESVAMALEAMVTQVLHPHGIVPEIFIAKSQEEALEYLLDERARDFAGPRCDLISIDGTYPRVSLDKPEEGMGLNLLYTFSTGAVEVGGVLFLSASSDLSEKAGRVFLPDNTKVHAFKKDSQGGSRLPGDKDNPYPTWKEAVIKILTR